MKERGRESKRVKSILRLIFMSRSFYSTWPTAIRCCIAFPLFNAPIREQSFWHKKRGSIELLNFSPPSSCAWRKPPRPDRVRHTLSSVQCRQDMIPCCRKWSFPLCVLPGCFIIIITISLIYQHHRQNTSRSRPITMDYNYVQETAGLFAADGHGDRNKVKSVVQLN